MSTKPEEITTFWKEAGYEKWFIKDDAFDMTIRDRFLKDVKAARNGELADWKDGPQGCLALILLLDQFTRNLFRGDSQAFAADGAARDLANLALKKDYATSIDSELRPFLFMPFMHSESIVDQRLSLKLQHMNGGPSNIKAAREHLEIICRFGRFPHRNGVLQRHTTPAEQAYLDDGGFKG
jgi:uncharacterized protein (DUF924 family)